MSISVVMAVHNGIRYLPEQLESVLQGDRLPDELVVVDDASSDDSAAFIAERMKAHPAMSLKMLRNERNQGPTRSFVKGILASSGSIVLPCDQDDRWMPHKIARMAACFAERPDLLMAYSDGLLSDADLVPDGRSIYGTRKHAHLDQGMDRAPLEVASNPDIKGCTMALNGDFVRELFQRTDPAFSTYWGHDHWAALFAWGRGPVVAIPEPLLWHRFHSTNASRAERFSLLRPGQVLRYLKAAKGQAADHYAERYRIALDQALAMGTDFRKDLLDALRTMLHYSERRRDLHRLSILQRIPAAWRLHREGLYRKHYNGFATLVRDMIL